MAMQSSAELVVRADAAVPARMANQACRIFDVRAGAARRCTRCSPSQLGRWRMAKFGGVLLAGPQARARTCKCGRERKIRSVYRLLPPN